MIEVATSLLADTHIWLRWRNDPRKLSALQARAISHAERRNHLVSVAAISLWELGQMVARGRVRVHLRLEGWLEEMAGHPAVNVIPITPRIASEAAQLGGTLPNDPADRLIIATARCHNLKLLTADERIRNWGGVPML